jgi:hypothetical protein
MSKQNDFNGYRKFKTATVSLVVVAGFLFSASLGFAKFGVKPTPTTQPPPPPVTSGIKLTEVTKQLGNYITASGTAKPNSLITINGKAIPGGETGATGNFSVSTNFGSTDTDNPQFDSSAALFPDCKATISDGTNTIVATIMYCKVSLGPAPKPVGKVLGVFYEPIPLNVGHPASTLEINVEPPAPAGGYLVSLISSDVSSVSVPATAFIPAGSYSVRVPFQTFATTPSYSAVKVTASLPGGSAFVNVKLIPSLSLWTLPAAPFSRVLFGATQCQFSAIQFNGFRAATRQRAIDDIINSYGGGGVTGANPGTEWIAANTFNSRCAKSFPNGFSIIQLRCGFINCCIGIQFNARL